MLTLDAVFVYLIADASLALHTHARCSWLSARATCALHRLSKARWNESSHNNSVLYFRYQFLRVISVYYVSVVKSLYFFRSTLICWVICCDLSFLNHVQFLKEMCFIKRWKCVFFIYLEVQSYCYSYKVKNNMKLKII